MDIKSGIGGLVIGIIVTIIFVFASGWGVTSGKAERMAQEAVVERLVGICEAQFLKGPDAGKRLKELKDTTYYKRGDYIREGGWAIMSDEEEPDSRVVGECARRLAERE